MRPLVRASIAAAIATMVSVTTFADPFDFAQGRPPLSRVMREKLGHAQAILGAVVTSDWTVLDRESRALALATRDPAWLTALTEREYLRESDAFSRALQDLIEASAKRDLDGAANAQIALTASCVRCHVHMTRRRIAK